ncbi:MAG TPA: class I SAM-dependent methyltransferase [Candidatus Kapabacteria bacterium]|nr:class I SAM-dependent methyltransferase [Candidatus Kapabacteria bacterium]
MINDHEINNIFSSPKQGSQDEVDIINKAFYGKFNYPWPPLSFYQYTDQKSALMMLNQDMGNWKHEILRGQPKIWVAGCGTNQAIFTALKFPESEVLGTEISTQSLETCKNTMEQLGITNLKLEEKSINNVDYQSQFDYIICTGVIHHNAVPKTSLDKLAVALKPHGMMELMVYNYYHMLIDASFQKAIRILCNTNSANSIDLQLAISKKLIRNFPVQNLMAGHILKYKDVHNDAELADMLLQPVLHSYTIETFWEMIASSNLECLIHCINQFDKGAGRLYWNMEFKDTETSVYYESLTDVERWQISNLLMMEQSPMLWFYLQRKDSPNRRKTEKEICNEFLDTKFAPHTTSLKVYVINNEGKYQLNAQFFSIPSPTQPTDNLSNAIFKLVNPGITMREIFLKLNIEPNFANVNRARINLTTSAFPYLKAVNLGNSQNAALALNQRQDEGDFNF